MTHTHMQFEREKSKIRAYTHANGEREMEKITEHTHTHKHSVREEKITEHTHTHKQSVREEKLKNTYTQALWEREKETIYTRWSGNKKGEER